MFGLAALSLVCESAEAELTKKEALARLKANGFRWRQTKTLSTEAEAKTAQARSALYPHVRLNFREYASRVNTLQFGASDQGDLIPVVLGESSVQSFYSILDSQARHRLDAAVENEKINVANTQQYQSDLTFVMFMQFLNSQRLKKKIEVTEATARRDEEIAQAAEAREKAGLGTGVDRMRAQALLEADRLKKLDATIAYGRALQDLAVYLGQVKLDSEPGPLAYDERVVTRNPRSIDFIVENRSDIQAAKATVSAAEQLKLSAEAAGSPKIHFFAEIGFLDVGLLGIGAPVVGSMGVLITVPIFNAGLITGKVQEEGAKLEKAELQLKQLDLESRSQIQVSYSQIQEAKLAVDLTNKQVKIAEEELRLTRQKYASGATSGLEMENSQASLATALDSNVEAIFNFELSKLNYYRSIGEIDKYVGAEEQPGGERAAL